MPDQTKKDSKAAKRPAKRKSGGGKRQASSKSRARKAKEPKPPKDKCFVISPFGGWHDDYYSELFCPAIKSAGLSPARADDLFRSSNIVNDIWHMVLSSRVLLADLTDKNPNVFYELGLAHAARKPVLLLTQSIDDVPFDLRALRVVAYDVEHPQWGELLVENIKRGLTEMIESPESSVLPTFLMEEPREHAPISEDEARLIALQQQIDSLQAELRASRASASPERTLRAKEARDLIRLYVEEGMPPAAITRRLSAMGPPKGWIRREIESQVAERDEDG